MTDDKLKPDQDELEKGQAEDGRKGDESLPSSVDQILQERLRLEQQQAELDQMLKDKFQKNITVMFTDIKGSTSYFETYGDVEGRAMVQRHNAMLFPKVEQYGGKVIKTIGDAIMAKFEDPAQGVKCAMAMQKVLYDYNQKVDQKFKRILVRIGLNFGPAVVEDDDVFGDAVNVAARVESKADAEQVLVSESLYKEVKADDEILVRFFGDVECKGKSEPVKIYQVIWSDEQMVAAGEFKKAATRRAVDKRGKVVRGRVLQLQASREGDSMKLSVSEHARGEEKTVSQYDMVKLDDSLISAQCEEVVNLLNRSNKRGKVSKEILKQLRAAGQILFDHLLTQEAKDKIVNSQAEHLTLRIDDRMVHIPWELLFDGKQFFCQRFGMGRIVSTRQKVADVPDRNIAKPLRMLVLADPRSDLPASNDEGIHIRDALESEYEFINVNMKASEVPVNYVKSKIRSYDIIHYAGHADYDREDPANSGWLLNDGKLSSGEFMNMTGGAPMPALVFANACQSGQTEEWEIEAGYEKDIFGLANAFLVSGVQHYVGTFWDILDDPGHDFALAFYQSMIDGKSVGESVRMARLKLIDKYGEDTIVWASYMLYGDPAFSYLEDVDAAEDTAEISAPETAEAAAPKAEPTQPGQPAVFRGADAAAQPAASSGMSKSMMGIIAAVIVVLIIAVLGGKALFSENPAEVRNQAYDKLAAKDYNGAIALFEKLKADPDTKRDGLAGLAATYNAMGLQASESGDREKALEYYEKAHEYDTKNAEASINLGQTYLAMGKNAEAQEAFEAAVTNDPNNVVAATLLAQVVAMMERANDQEKQAEVDAMVNDLVDRWKSGKMPTPKKDGDEWTSKPVTVTFLDFDQKGKSTMEGEMEFLKIALGQALNDTGRVTVVEREKIDRILSELNLAASDLANEQTRLKLGNLFGAKLIATGSFIRHKGEAQVNLRLIETETSQVPIAVTEIFTDKDKAGDIATKVAAVMADKIVKQFPLQAKVLSVEDDTVKINVGENAGAKKGMKLEILDADQTMVGMIEITSVGPEVSKAKVIEKPDKLSVGAKVKEAE